MTSSDGILELFSFFFSFLIHSAFAYTCILISSLALTVQLGVPRGVGSDVFQASVVLPICQEKPLLQVKEKSLPFL